MYKKISVATPEDAIISLCKTEYMYDIIAESDKKKILKILKSNYGSDSKIVKDGIFGMPLLVLDTFTDFKDAKEIFFNIEKHI